MVAKKKKIPEKKDTGTANPKRPLRNGVDEALRESEENYRTVFENTGTATIVVEENNIISLTNAEFAKLSGYSKNDIEGKKCWTEFVVKEDLEQMLAQQRLRRQNREKALTHYEFRFVTKSGDIRNIYLTIDVIPGTKKTVASLQDITDRKRVEEALRTSEHKYRTLVENIPEKIFVKDVSLTYVSCNEHYAHDLGIISDAIAGKTDFDFYPRDLAEKYRADDRAVMDSGETKAIEERYVADGKEFWVSTIKTPIRNDAGNVSGILGIFHDITDRKQPEEALKVSEQKFRTMMNWTYDWEYWIDQNRDIVYVSPSSEHITGYSVDEFIADKGLIDRIVHPDDRSLWEGHIQIHTQGKEGEKPFEVEFRIIAKDGSIRWISHICRAIFADDGTWIGRRVSNRDITDRKRVEAALRESEERYRTLTESSPDQIFIVGRDDTMKYVNTAALKLFRLPYNQVVGTPRKNLFPPGIADAQGILLKKVFETGELVKKEEKIQFGTQEFWIDTSSVPLKDMTGNVTAVLGIARDITEHKKAEALQKRFNEELEQKVKSRTEELNALLQEKIILLREVHHRVKNNLQIIISLINLQMRQIDDKQMKQIMAETQHRVRAMSLVYEKLSQSENLSQIDLSDYTRFLATQLFSYYKVNFQKVALEIAIEKVMVDINTAIPLGLIINELISNALNHAFPSDRKGRITISSQYENKVLTLVIKDDGIGLPHDLDCKNPESLGLRLVNNLVEQLNGTIKVERELGTTYIISVHLEIE